MRHETEQMRHPPDTAGSSNGAIPSDEGLDPDDGGFDSGAPFPDRAPDGTVTATPTHNATSATATVTATRDATRTTNGWPAIEERPAFDLTNPPIADGDTTDPGPRPQPEPDDQP
jgi:hypothetical protein